MHEILPIQEYQKQTKARLIGAMNNNITESKTIDIINLEDFFYIANSNNVTHILYYYFYYDREDFYNIDEDLLEFILEKISYNKYNKFITDLNADLEIINNEDFSVPFALNLNFIVGSQTYALYLANYWLEIKKYKSRHEELLKENVEIYNTYIEYLFKKSKEKEKNKTDNELDFIQKLKQEEYDKEKEKIESELLMLLQELEQDEDFSFCTNKQTRMFRATTVISENKDKYPLMSDYRTRISHNIDIQYQADKLFNKIKLDKRKQKEQK